jgi:hypothetical protein
MTDDIEDDEIFAPTAPTGQGGARPGAGRPTDYDPAFIPIAKGMCAMGATDYELACEFGVTSRAVQMWRLRYPDFEKATRVGKTHADLRVERSLFQRATGYTFESEKIVTVSVGDGISQVERVPIVEHVPPSESAALKWLMNRRGKVWRDKQEVETSGTMVVRVEGGLPDGPPPGPPTEDEEPAS